MKVVSKRGVLRGNNGGNAPTSPTVQVKGLPPRPKPMKRISDKQKARNKKLAKIPLPKDGRCVKCGKAVTWPPLARHHKVRRSDLGTDDRENIDAGICQECHSLQVGEKSRDKTKPIDRPTDITGLSGWHGLRPVPKPGKRKE